ncbi:MAG: trigger factor, partial [bacterium]
PAHLEDLQYEPGSDLSAKFSVEVEPEFDVKKIENFKLEKQIYEVSEADIQSELEHIQEEQALWEVSEEPATDGDFVTIDLQEISEAGVPVIGHKYQDEVVAITSKNGEPTEFGRQLKGTVSGDVRMIWFTPETNPNDERPKESLRYEASVKEVKRRILPIIDDELAKDVGEYESIDELKESLKKSIAESMQKRFDDQLHQILIDEIIKSNPFDLPQGMVTRYLDNLVERLKDSAKNGDIDETAIRENYKPGAIWSIKWHLLRRKLIASSGVDVNDEEVHDWVVSGKKGTDANRAWNQIKNDADQLERLRDDLLEKKLLDFLVSKQKIKEKKVNRNDLMKKSIVQV